MFTLNKKTRKIFILVLSFIAFGMIIAMVSAYTFPGVENSKTVKLHSTAESGIEYSVMMSENPIYDSSVLTDEKYYLKPFTDKIRIECKTEILCDTEAHLECTSRVYGLLISEISDDNGKDIVWEKRYDYAYAKTVEETGKSLSVDRVASITLDKYQELVSSLIDEHNILTDYYLRVVFENYITVSADDQSQNEVVTTFLEIPFTDNVMEIRNLSPEIYDIQIEENTEIKKAVNKNLVLVFALILGACIISLFILIFRTKGIDKSDLFKNEIDKIFKEYGNRLAGLTDTLAYQSSIMISIDKIEDMVKIADEIGQTIFYYEVDEKDERKIEFYVFDEGRIYYLVIFGALSE